MPSMLCELVLDIDITCFIVSIIEIPVLWQQEYKTIGILQSCCLKVASAPDHWRSTV